MSTFFKAVPLRLLAFTKRHGPRWAQRHIERLEASSIGRRMASGTFWSLSSNVFTRLLNLATAVVMTRILGKALYGEIGMVQSTVDMFSVVAGLGLSFTATKHVAEFRVSSPRRAGRIIAMASILSWVSGALVALVAFLMAPWLAIHTLKSPQIVDLLRVGAFLLLFGTINAAQVGSLSGLEAFRSRAVANSVSAVLNLPLILLGSWLYGPLGAVAGMTIGYAALCLLNARALRVNMREAGIRAEWREWRSEFGILTRFALPTMATSMIIPPVGWACNTMLVQRPDGFAELGVYNAAGQWANFINFLPSLIGVVSMAIYAQLVSEGQWHRLERLMWSSVRANALLVIPVIILSVLSPWLMHMYGAEFARVPSVMVFRLLAALTVALYTPVWPLLLAAGHAKAVLVINLLWAAALLLLTRWLVVLGAVGMALANFVGTFFYLACMLGFAVHVLRKATTVNAHRPVSG